MASPIFITEVEWELLSDSAFNPPDCSTAETAATFRAEYWAAHDAIRASAERYVETARIMGAASEREDFFTMNDDFGNSRFISVESHSPALISLDFARHIQRALRTLPESYVVALEHDLLDERFSGLFDAFITADCIRVFSAIIYARSQFQDG